MTEEDLIIHQGFVKEEKIIDLAKANFYGFIGLIPIAILYGVPFFLLWPDVFSKEAVKESLDGAFLSLTLGPLIIMVVGVVLHELLHGLTWSLFTKHGFKSIRFGIMKKMLTPYCHCKEPLKIKHYILGAVMPGIVLGFMPFLISLYLGSFSWLLLAIFFTMAAIGDFMIIHLLRKENREDYVLDHPSEAGCYVFRKIN